MLQKTDNSASHCLRHHTPDRMRHNEVVEQCLTGHKYGFLGGLWHGFIAPFDFIGMLFSKDITMYAQNNNGGLYASDFFWAAVDGDFSAARGQTGSEPVGSIFLPINSIRQRWWSNNR